MHVRRELQWTIGSLALLNLLFAFGAIGLFVRMGPAIQRILEENVYSIVAAEEVLAVLARAGGEPASAEQRRRVESALERARKNVTDAQERPVLESLAKRLPRALAEPSGRERVVEDLEHFIRINREAMQAVDVEAQRLGTAGAWAAVLIGFLSFIASLLVFSRIEKRLLKPLMELLEVLQGVQEGVQMRRCRTPDATREVVQVTEAVNRLLDERLARAAKAPSSIEDFALGELLERQPEGAAIVDVEGHIVRANRAMLALLAEEGADGLRQAIAGKASSCAGVSREAIGEKGWLVTVPAEREAREAAGAG